VAARARAVTATEAAEWAHFVRKVPPLAGRAAVAPPDSPGRPDPPAPETVSPRGGLAAEAFRKAAATEPAAKTAPVGIGGQPAGVDGATWRRFQRGKLESARKLDLHGMTAHHAFQALRAFLRAAQADRLRCVEIVTGRGSGEEGGVLRREFPLWLNLPEIRPLVLAASHPHRSSAMHAVTANHGSVRLLLRRPRP
jgi:DNA-nicking Smr family endonuclease